MKSLMGLCLLVFAGRTIWRNLILASSSEAVVTGEFIDLATPIEGHPTLEPIEPGTIVAANRLLATIQNSRVDRTVVNELRSNIEGLDGEIRAIDSVVRTLDTFWGRFESRGRSYRARRAAQLNILLAQSQSRLEADRARVDASQARSRRAEELSKLGLSSTQTVEEAQTDAAVTAKTLAADEHEHESLVATLQALNDGFSLGDLSAMDKSYSSQRGDDIALRLAQLRGTLAEKQARRAALAADLDAQSAQVELLAKARVTAPRRARLMSIAASDAAYVARGAPLMRLVDCTRLRVLAYLNEWGYDRVHIGDAAEVTLNPGRRKYRATVSLRLGSPDARFTGTSALSMPPDQRERFAVVVSSAELGAALGERCEAGLNADVLFHPSGR